MEKELPSSSSVLAVLAESLDSNVEVVSVEDLSPGLSPALVMRVVAKLPESRLASLIVKVPGWGRRSLLDPRDPMLATREARFLSGAVPGRLPEGIQVPPEATVVSHEGAEWIIMRDVGAALAQPWDPAMARVAARRIALLYAPAVADPAILDTEWLEREGFSAYAHHAAAGHENLRALDGLFSADEVRRLHACLDRVQDFTARAKLLPATLVHGDFHLRNAALDEQGALLLIDWEHVGIGPVGVDLGTFVSVYHTFGGRGELDEQALLDDYGHALSEVAGADLREEAAAGYAIAHLTWGLHLRLGPGLTAVRTGRHGTSPQEQRPYLDDIRAGCRRAIRWADTLF